MAVGMDAKLGVAPARESQIGVEDGAYEILTVLYVVGGLVVAIVRKSGTLRFQGLRLQLRLKGKERR